MNTKVVDILPRFLLEPSRTIRNIVRYIPIRGNGQYCPICKKSSKRFVRNKAGSLRCMWCFSGDRHRLAWLYFERMTDLLNRQFGRLIDIAPTPSIAKQLKKRIGSSYITADINPHRAMIQMDISDIQFPDEVFDAVYCCHVLEHVSDDRRALSELYRILKPEGFAILQVPINAAKTFEDPSVTDPAQRSRLFGHEEHVRLYGPDFVERIKEAGFDVKIVHPSDFLREKEMTWMGITEAAGDIYHCTKHTHFQSARVLRTRSNA